MDRLSGVGQEVGHGQSSHHRSQLRPEHSGPARENLGWRVPLGSMLRAHRCLFCRQRDGGFTSREHIFPETVGNTDLAMLPPAVVCDKCNNGPLAVLDQSLCAHLPIAMRRAMLGISNKAGKGATVRFAQGRIEPLPMEEVAPGDSHGLRFVDPGSGRPLVRDVSPGVGLQLKIEGQGGRRLTPRYFSELSRSILKIGFELAYLDYGDELFEPRFDRVRGAILGVRDTTARSRWRSGETRKTSGCRAPTWWTRAPASEVLQSTSLASYS